MRRRLRAVQPRVDRVFVAMNKVVVDPVFEIPRAVVVIVEPPGIRLVFGEQQFRSTLTKEPAVPVSLMTELNHGGVFNVLTPVESRAFGFLSPRPRIAKPDGGKQMKRCRFRPSVGYVDANEQVFRGG